MGSFVEFSVSILSKIIILMSFNNNNFSFAIMLMGKRELAALLSLSAGKGLTSWLSFVVSSVSLSLSHWYPGSGVVLDCIDS